MRALIRGLVETLIRLFFPVLRVSHGERLQQPGPILIVPNHNNGLLDPMVVRLASGLPVRFLAKSSLFGNPLGRLAMTTFGAIPVYRAQESEGADRDRALGNERTFAACRAALGRGEPMALFPEGTSHSEPQLKPFKTGAARIALSTEAEHDFRLGLRVIPAALQFDAKTIFRSSALVSFGEPIEVARYAEAYAADPHEAARALTQAMREGLEAEALTADTRELLEGIARVSGYAAGSAREAADPAQRHERAKAMLRAYRRLAAQDPARLEALVAEARGYDDRLRELGVDDPWDVEVGRVTPGAVLRELIVLGVLAPIALVGALISWLPYRAVGVLAARAEEDVRGTVKLVAGLFLLPLWWLLVAALVGILIDGRVAALALLLAIPTGYAALRFEERWQRARAALAHAWLRRARAADAEELAERRRALATRVEAALREPA